MPRLIWVFAGHTVIWLVLSRGGSYDFMEKYGKLSLNYHQLLMSSAHLTFAVFNKFLNEIIVFFIKLSSFCRTYLNVSVFECNNNKTVISNVFQDSALKQQRFSYYNLARTKLKYFTLSKLHSLLKYFGQIFYVSSYPTVPIKMTWLINEDIHVFHQTDKRKWDTPYNSKTACCWRCSSTQVIWKLKIIFE